MTRGKVKLLFNYIGKSKFIRSIFFQTTSVFFSCRYHYCFDALMPISELAMTLTDSSGHINIFMRAPLLGSTALKMLCDPDGKSEAEENDEHEIVDLEGKRVLLAEDTAINRLIARSIISETRAEVVEAVNGKEAVEAFAAQPAGYFDLILMDVQMPVMDGLAATAAIRAMQRPDAATIPIYALTANTFDEDVREVMKSGMNGHLGKPYSKNDLHKVLSYSLFKRNSQ